MPAVMLDSDICIYVMKGRPAAVSRRLARIDPEDVFVSCIAVAELWTGIFKSALRERNQIELERFLSGVRILDWPAAAVVRYGSVRAHLERRGTPIGEMDLLIAAHALHENLPLITNNREEFRRVPGLKVESWLR
ncbi:MAG TPA: type II toxin-antitoxin system VapC family toxin [Candidatus Binataceae bacterium]|nr:type II toxin-antitoxin system VapC family toxin [Candidatus Binataceae bacterium]